MDICKAPTPRHNALNKHNALNVHRDGECYPQFNKKLTRNVHTNKVQLFNRRGRQKKTN